MQARVQAKQQVGLLAEHMAGAVAYFSFIPAIIFFWLAPYSKSRFVRYHSVQCLLLCGSMLIVAAVLRLVGLVVLIIPILAPLVFLAWVLAGLGAFLLWLVLVIKALQGEMFKLPVLGEVAERYAGTA